MNKKQETIADIIAEMRSLVKPGETLEHTYELLNGLADRIEAAHKREVGNGAKMYEALEQIASIPMPPPIHLAQQCAREMREKAIAALAAPLKNCERFRTWDEAKDAYWREQGDPCDWRKLGAWLFAPEGGAK